MFMMDQFNECADNLCEHLMPRADGKTLVAMLDDFHNVTLDVIAKVTLVLKFIIHNCGLCI